MNISKGWMILNIVKDLWVFIRHIMWKAWKTHRQIRKGQRAIMQLEKRNGVCNTFLLFFEEAIAQDTDEDEIIWMLGTFIDTSDDDVRAEIGWEDVLSYATKYDVEIKSG